MCIRDRPNTVLRSNNHSFENKNKPITEEFNVGLKVQLKKFTRGEVFLANNTNNTGNIDFDTDFKYFHGSPIILFLVFVMQTLNGK